MMKDGEKFRASNGSDLESFMSFNCEDCERDKAWRDTQADGVGCRILAKGIRCERPEESPEEWIWKNKEPYCLAYVRPGEIVLEVDDLTLPLFLEEI